MPPHLSPAVLGGGVRVLAHPLMRPGRLFCPSYHPATHTHTHVPGLQPGEPPLHHSPPPSSHPHIHSHPCALCLLPTQENHHCAIATAILNKKDCALLKGLPLETRKALRKIMIAAILSTDMAQHYSLTSDFTKHPVLFNPDEEADRLLLLKVGR